MNVTELGWGWVNEMDPVGITIGGTLNVKVVAASSRLAPDWVPLGLTVGIEKL